MGAGPKVHIDMIMESEHPDVIATFARVPRIGNLHRVIANSPVVFSRFIGWAHGLRNETELDPGERELGILCVLERHGGDFEIVHHRPYAMTFGVTEEQVLNVCNPDAGDIYSDRQKAILAFAERVAAHPADWEKQKPDNIEAYLSQRQIVELALNLIFYIGMAHFTAVIGVPMDD